MNSWSRAAIALLLVALSSLQATDSRPVDGPAHDRHRRSSDLGTLTAAASGILNEGHAPLTDCTALKDAGFTTTGLYKIFPGDAEGEFTVFCDMDLLSGGWTVVQRRVSDSFDFDRKWDEYRNGFGDFNENFWLGLHKIKRITDMGNYELYIGLEDFDSDTAFARYGSFSLGSEQSNYKLNIDNYDVGSTAGDSLSTHNTEAFSTPDRDNDASGIHCAEKFKGGWWYKNCHDSNLNGVYYSSGSLPDSAVPDGVMWSTWLTQYKPAKTSVVAVRRV